MASPFAVFRKNQKVLMALLVGFSMLAFIVADSVNPQNFPIFIGALLGAVALWLLSGKSGGEGWTIAAVGAVLGAVVGWYGPTFIRDNTIVQTADGGLSMQDIARINDRQGAANSFLQIARQTIAKRIETANAGKPAEQRQPVPQPEFFGFVPTNSAVAARENALMTFLFEKEADKLGIALDDPAVIAYLNDAFDGKLTQDDVKRVRSQLKLGAGELMDLLREQLRVREAFRLLAPPPSGPQPEMAILAMFQKVWPPTPEQLWEEFRKVTATAEVTAVAIPAEAFVSEVPKPDEAELAAFFNRYKSIAPGPGGTPGFLVDRRYQVAYLEIDADELKKNVTPPTDEEVRAVYEKTRAQLPNPQGSTGKTGQPVEAPKPNTATPSIPMGGTDAPSGADQKPEGQSETQPAPAGETPAAPESPPGEGSSALERDGVEFVAFQDEQPAADASNPTEAPKPESERTDAPSISPPDFPAPPVANPAESEAETMKAIRDDLISQRVRAMADERMKKAQEDLFGIINEIYDKVAIPEDLRDAAAKRKYDEDRASAAREVGERMKTYAEQHAKEGVKFHRTPLLTGQELYESENYPIGKALLWQENQPFGGRGLPSVADQLVTSTPEQPLAPIAAQSVFNNDRFVAVKTADEAPRVPTLDEKPVREKVEKAWKFAEARKLAQKRADDLAKADAKDKDLAEAVKGQSVTGKKGGQELTARQVGPFSWLRKSTVPSTMMNLPALVPTTLPQLPGAGDQLMEAVFRKLKPGETTVVPADDGSTFYVVELDKRTSDEELAKLREDYLKEQNEFFGFGPYHMRQLQDAQQLQADWFRAFRQRHGVVDDATPEEPAA